MLAKQLPTAIGKYCGVTVWSIAALAIIGWLTHIRVLVQVDTHYAPMQFNTALCFLAAGVGLIAATYQRKIISFLCGTFIAAITLSTLVEYQFQIDLGLDLLFFQPYILTNTVFPGRMAIITAIGLFLIGLILMSTLFQSRKIFILTIRLASSVVLILGIVPLAGYLSGIEVAYSLNQYKPMAIPTAVAFVLFGMGASAYTWQINFVKNEILLASWFSLISTVVVLLYTFAVWQQSQNKEKEFVQEIIQEKANLIEHNLRNRIINSVQGLKRMAERWEVRNGTPKSEWSADAQNYLNDISPLKAIQWVDNDYKVRWIETVSGDDSPKVTEVRFDAPQKRIFTDPKNNLTLFLTPLSILVKGHSTFTAYISLYTRQGFQGFIAGVYDIQRLIDGAVSPQLTDLFMIRLMDEADLEDNSIQTNVIKKQYYKTSFQLFNRTWALLIQPKSKFFKQQISATPHLELISGSIIALLVGMVIYYTITSSVRNKQLREKSEALSLSEKRQQQIVSDLQDFAVYWLDLNGNVETWNRGAKRIFGYESKEILGKNYSQFFTIEEQEQHLPQHMLEAAVASNKYKSEGWLVKIDETQFWANMTVEIVQDNAGEVVGFAMITQDMSEKRVLEAERSRLIATIDECNDFIGMADMDGNLLYHNAGAKQMVGFLPDFDMRGMKIGDMHPAWAYQKISEQAIPTVLNRGSWSGETALLHHKTGKEIPVLQTLTLHRNEFNVPSYLTTVMCDISERKRSEEALKNSEETFRSAMEYAAIGMALVSLEGRWLKVNHALCQIVGYLPEEVLKTDFQTITHPDDMELDLNYVAQLLAGKILTYQIEKRYIHKNGGVVWVLLNVSLLRNTEDQPLYFIAQIQDIDKQKKAEQELKYVAYHDVLTGLSNRKHLDIAFEMALKYAKRHKTKIAVMFMDLDKFKGINDQYGHDIGDLLLVEIAARLRASVRETDIIVRLGGDEFIIALTELQNSDRAIEVAEKILDSIAEPMMLKQHEIKVTASIGVSIYPDDDLDLKTLLKYADQALYEVKAKDRDNYGIYTPPPGGNTPAPEMRQ